MNSTTPITLIGTGHLGRSILETLIKKGHQNLIATRRNQAELEKLKIEIPTLDINKDNQAAVQAADVIILTAKEYSFEDIADQIKSVKNGKLLISLGPTFTLKKLEALFGHRIIRLMMPVDPLNDLIFYTPDKQCSPEDKKTVEYIFGNHTQAIPEDQMAIATTHVLFRGLFNAFLNPLQKASTEAGMNEALTKKAISHMLISAGKEIEAGVDGMEKLKKASGGFNEESFTLKLFNDLKPSQNEFERQFKKYVRLLKRMENESSS